MRKIFGFLLFIFSVATYAQPFTNGYSFTQANDIQVLKNGDSLINAWAGGVNFVEINTIDLNNDGMEDLLVHEKSGSVLLPFLNRGVRPNGETRYKFAPQYKQYFPEPEGFFLLRDYNCDDKKDIFYGRSGKLIVYKNISTGGTPAFEKAHQSTFLKGLLSSGYSDISIPNGDIPGIVDVNGDGALDILTFEDTYVDWIANKAPCGLDFEYREKCWGHFTEDGFANSIYLDNCVPSKPKRKDNGNEDGKQKVQHAGSAVLPLDLNGDNVMELLVSDVSYPNTHALYNTGNPDSAFMSSKDTAFPSYDTSIYVPQFPAMFHEDVTGDGNRDLIVSPNESYTPASSFINHNNLWLYKNTGTDANPHFTFSSKNFLRNTQIDIGEGCVPRFVDINGDSLQDLILSNNFYRTELNEETTFFVYLKNVGLSYFPIFEIVDTNFANMPSYGLGRSLIPAFGDLDNDGDLDMIVGDENGQMHYFTNTGTRTAPQYSLTTPGISNGVDLGSNAAPFLFDMDNDGDMDLIAGNRNGRLSYFENLSATEPFFYKKTDYFGGVGVYTSNCPNGFSVPYLFEDQGSINMVVGSGCSGARQFDSISPSAGETIRAQVGNGNLVSTDANESPMGTSDRKGKNQMLFHADELKAAGLSYGNITGLSFSITSNQNPTLPGGITISMKNVAYEELGSDFDSNLRIVHRANKPYSIGSGLFYTQLDNTFLWDGESNLLVQVCFTNTKTENLVRVEMSNTDFKSNSYAALSEPGAGCDLPLAQSINKRPNIEFQFTPSFVETFTYFNEGFRTAPAIADINGDRYMDAVVGGFGGGVTYYRGKKFHVGLPEKEFEETDRLLVFPNPGNGHFTVHTENISSADINVFDLTGRLVQRIKVSEERTAVDISREPAGIYLFILNDGDKMRSQKVILE